MRSTHPPPQGKPYPDLVDDHRVRVLTDDEVARICIGEGRSVIQKKPVASSNAYWLQAEAEPWNEDIPIGLYPSIVKYGSDYYQLHCRYCGGNANIVRGGKKRGVFF
jgi:hypothetical protein